MHCVSYGRVPVGRWVFSIRLESAGGEGMRWDITSKQRLAPTYFYYDDDDSQDSSEECFRRRFNPFS